MLTNNNSSQHFLEGYYGAFDVSAEIIVEEDATIIYKYLGGTETTTTVISGTPAGQTSEETKDIRLMYKENGYTYVLSNLKVKGNVTSNSLGGGSNQVTVTLYYKDGTSSEVISKSGNFSLEYTPVSLNISEDVDFIRCYGKGRSTYHDPNGAGPGWGNYNITATYVGFES